MRLFYNWAESDQKKSLASLVEGCGRETSSQSDNFLSFPEALSIRGSLRKSLAAQQREKERDRMKALTPAFAQSLFTFLPQPPSPGPY